MISIWLAAYLWHVLEITPDVWFGLPFMITALLSAILEVIVYMGLIIWASSR